MPYVDRREARIWYTVQGTGFPVLTLAPGGMRSSVPLWEMAAINPLTAYAGQYRMIAMDQRNAGRSAGPLETGDPWGAYAADQLAVMDHLGIGRFLAFGCCIGGPFILKLCQLAPDRVVAAVLEQPAGITAGNRELFDNLWKPWGEQLMSSRDDLGRDEIEAFAAAMWAPDLAVSVTRDQVPDAERLGRRCNRACATATDEAESSGSRAKHPPDGRPPSCRLGRSRCARAGRSAVARADLLRRSLMQI